VAWRKVLGQVGWSTPTCAWHIISFVIPPAGGTFG